MITHFSPYYKAACKIAEVLGIKIQSQTRDQEVLFQFNFTPQLIQPQQKLDVGLHWQHASLEEEIDAKKETILVWSATYNHDFIRELIGSAYNMIPQAEAKALLSIAKVVKIKALLLYAKPIDEELLKLIFNLKEKFPQLKVIYITETTEYRWEERLIDVDIDLSLQMPVSQKLVQHKIGRLLQTTKIKGVDEVNTAILERILKLEDPNPEEEIVRKALKIIQEKHVDPHFGVKQLYETLGISKIKCYRIFKEVTKLPPSEFLLNIRMQKARRLLLKSSLNIAEIAYQTGFSDPKYFSKVFKKTYGESPKKYRVASKQ